MLDKSFFKSTSCSEESTKGNMEIKLMVDNKEIERTIISIVEENDHISLVFLENNILLINKDMMMLQRYECK
jgi:hypothetical protein